MHWKKKNGLNLLNTSQLLNSLKIKCTIFKKKLMLSITAKVNNAQLLCLDLKDTIKHLNQLKCTR